MARKKKKRIRVEKEARRIARAAVGAPPAGRTIPDKRHRPPKHKPTAADLLQE